MAISNKLLKAWRKGDLYTVRRSFNEGAILDVHEREAEYNDLHLGVMSKNIESVFLLLELTGEKYLHSTTKVGMTPLHLAAQNLDLEMIKLLLQKGAQIDQGRCSHGTALSKAVSTLYGDENKRLQVVQYLVNAGADINFHYGSRHCSLLVCLAGTSGNLDVADYLLEKGVTIESRNERQQTALQVAALEGRLEIVERLIQHRANVAAGFIDTLHQELKISQVQMQISTHNQNPLFQAEIERYAERERRRAKNLPRIITALKLYINRPKNQDVSVVISQLGITETVFSFLGIHCAFENCGSVSKSWNKTANKPEFAARYIANSIVALRRSLCTKPKEVEAVWERIHEVQSEIARIDCYVYNRRQDNSSREIDKEREDNLGDLFGLEDLRIAREAFIEEARELYEKLAEITQHIRKCIGNLEKKLHLLNTSKSVSNRTGYETKLNPRQSFVPCPKRSKHF